MCLRAVKKKKKLVLRLAKQLDSTAADALTSAIGLSSPSKGKEKDLRPYEWFMAWFTVTTTAAEVVPACVQDYSSYSHFMASQANDLAGGPGHWALLRAFDLQ
jgi:hypothetical protein